MKENFTVDSFIKEYRDTVSGVGEKKCFWVCKHNNKHFWCGSCRHKSYLEPMGMIDYAKKLLLLSEITSEQFLLIKEVVE